MESGPKIASPADVTTEDTLLFTVRNEDDEDVEAILTRFADGVAAYRNFCSHWTDVRLDRGDGAPIRNGEIMCRKHGATFEKASGYCNFGPCEGATLDEVAVEETDDGIYLVDTAYEFQHLGESETNADSSGADLSTNPGGRLGF